MADLNAEDDESLVSRFLGSDSEESESNEARMTPEQQARAVISTNVGKIADAIDNDGWDVVDQSFAVLLDSYEKQIRLFRHTMPENWCNAILRVFSTVQTLENDRQYTSSLPKSALKAFSRIRGLLKEERATKVRDAAQAFLAAQTTNVHIDEVAPIAERDDGIDVQRIFSMFKISFEDGGDDAEEEKRETENVAVSSGPHLSVTAVLNQSWKNCKNVDYDRQIQLLYKCPNEHLALHILIGLLEGAVEQKASLDGVKLMAVLQAAIRLMADHPHLWDEALPEQIIATATASSANPVLSPSASLPYMQRILTVSGVLMRNILSTRETFAIIFIMAIHAKAIPTLRTIAAMLLRDSYTLGDRLVTPDSQAWEASLEPAVPVFSGADPPGPPSRPLAQEIARSRPQLANDLQIFLAMDSVSRAVLLYRCVAGQAPALTDEFDASSLPSFADLAREREEEEARAELSGGRWIEQGSSFSRPLGRTPARIAQDFALLRVCVAVCMTPNYQLGLSLLPDGPLSLHPSQAHIYYRALCCAGISALIAGNVSGTFETLRFVSSAADNTEVRTQDRISPAQAPEAERDLRPGSFVEASVIDLIFYASSMLGHFRGIDGQARRQMLFRMLQVVRRDATHDGSAQATAAKLFQAISQANVAKAVQVTHLPVWAKVQTIYSQEAVDQLRAVLEAAVRIVCCRVWLISSLGNLTGGQAGLDRAKVCARFGVPPDELEELLDGLA